MSPAAEEPSGPSIGEVLGALGEAASQLGALVSHTLDEQPGVALAAALAAGFIAGGGLTSPLGARLTTAALRTTITNVGTLAALDLLRRALEENLGPQSNDAS